MREDAPTLRSRTGMRVPSTIHSPSTASGEVCAGAIASSGPIRWITLHTDEPLTESVARIRAVG